MNELLTMKEAAKVLHTNVNYVHELRRAGLIPVIKLGNYKIRRQTLEQFLERYEGWDLTNPFQMKKLTMEILNDDTGGNEND